MSNGGGEQSRYTEHGRSAAIDATVLRNIRRHGGVVIPDHVSRPGAPTFSPEAFWPRSRP